MAGYINGKVEIFCGDSPPSNLNLLWYRRLINDGLDYYALYEFDRYDHAWKPFVEDSLTSTSQLKALSANQGKTLFDIKAPKDSPVFTGSQELVSNIPIGDENGDNIFTVRDVNHGLSFTINDYGFIAIWKLLQLIDLPTFADNAAASSLGNGTVYKTPTGQLMVKY